MDAKHTKDIPYSLRRDHLLIPDENIHKYAINLLKFRGNSFWNNLPVHLEESQSLLEFKLLLKQSGHSPCICSVCKSVKV